jgi:hypothetical protein
VGFYERNCRETKLIVILFLSISFLRSQIVRIVCECFRAVMAGFRLLIQRDDGNLNGRFA